VEAEEPYDFEQLRIEHGSWDIRSYPPAIVGLWRT
jgi:hypothetical protein